MNVKEDMLKKKKEINEKTHITIVFITHEMDVAKKFSFLYFWRLSC